MKTPREISDESTLAYNAHDITGFVASARADVVVVTPDAGELKGRDQFMEYSTGLLQAFPDATIDVTARHDTSNGTVDEWIFHGTHTGPLSLPTGEAIPPTGRPVAVRGINVDTFEDGQVVSSHTYYDQVQFLTQLGLLPEL